VTQQVVSHDVDLLIAMLRYCIGRIVAQEQLEQSDSSGHMSLMKKSLQHNLHQLRLQASKGDEETHQGVTGIPLNTLRSPIAIALGYQIGAPRHST
jgi:hypothetical protein